MIIKKSELRGIVSEAGLYLGGDVEEKLNKEVRALVKKACERTITNGRKTMYARDL